MRYYRNLYKSSTLVRGWLSAHTCVLVCHTPVLTSQPHLHAQVYDSACESHCFSEYDEPVMNRSSQELAPMKISMIAMRAPAWNATVFDLFSEALKTHGIYEIIEVQMRSGNLTPFCHRFCWAWWHVTIALCKPIAKAQLRRYNILALLYCVVFSRVLDLLNGRAVGIVYGWTQIHLFRWCTVSVLSPVTVEGLGQR